MVYKEKMYSQRGIVSYMRKTDRNLRFPEHFSAAIFDFDGTLADTTQLWQKIDREFFESRNIPYDTTLSEHISPLGFTDGARWVIETYHLHESVEVQVGDTPVTIRAFLLGGIIMIPQNLIYAEYSTAYSEDGGQFVYFREAGWPFMAMFFIWSCWWASDPVGIAIMAMNGHPASRK